MYTQHEIKKQQSRCWSNHFITNLNKGDGEGEGGGLPAAHTAHFLLPEGRALTEVRSHQQGMQSCAPATQQGTARPNCMP